jgi:hypothetical protein
MITFSLTKTQAVYVVAALRIALDARSELMEHDRMAMEGIMYELSSPMNLSADVRSIVEDTSVKLREPGTAWSNRGVVLDSGTRFRFIYKQTHYEGAIIDGFWVLGAAKYHTPNQMIQNLVPQTRNGKKAIMNAWLVIDVLIPFSNEWIRLDNLRGNISRRGKK